MNGTACVGCERASRTRDGGEYTAAERDSNECSGQNSRKVRLDSDIIKIGLRRAGWGVECEFRHPSVITLDRKSSRKDPRKDKPVHARTRGGEHASNGAAVSERRAVPTFGEEAEAPQERSLILRGRKEGTRLIRQGKGQQALSKIAGASRRNIPKTENP